MPPFCTHMYEHRSCQTLVGTAFSFSGKELPFSILPWRSNSLSTVKGTYSCVDRPARFTWNSKLARCNSAPIWKLYSCTSVSECPDSLPFKKQDTLTREQESIAVLTWLSGFWSWDQRGWDLSESHRCNQGGIYSAPAQVWSFFQVTEINQSCPWVKHTWISVPRAGSRLLAADETNPEQPTDQTIFVIGN